MHFVCIESEIHNCKKHKQTVENIDERKKNKTKKKLRDDMKTKKNV